MGIVLTDIMHCSHKSHTLVYCSHWSHVLFYCSTLFSGMSGMPGMTGASRVRVMTSWTAQRASRDRLMTSDDEHTLAKRHDVETMKNTMMYFLFLLWLCNARNATGWWRYTCATCVTCVKDVETIKDTTYVFINILQFESIYNHTISEGCGQWLPSSSSRSIVSFYFCLLW